MALAFLQTHPDFNVAALIGLPIGDLEFVRIAGGVEVLFGLLLISGALPQVCVLVAGIPFNATLWFFGTDELVGHLPVYGAMLVLLVYGSDPVLRPAVKELWPFGRSHGVGDLLDREHGEQHHRPGQHDVGQRPVAQRLGHAR